VSAANAIHLAVTAMVAVVLAFRLAAVRRNPGDPAVLALFLATLCFQVALVLGYPSWYWAVDRLLGGVPCLPQFAQYAAVMAMFHFASVFALHLVEPDPEEVRRGVRRHRWLVAAALALLAVTYLAGPFRLGMRELGWTGQRDRGVLAFVLTTQLYSGVVLLGMVRLSWRHRRIERRFLRLGLRFLGVGALFGFLQGVHKIVYLAALGAGHPLPWNENGPKGVQALFLLPAVLCTTIGILLPAWGSRIALRWSRERSYRRLAPLADALREVLPAGEPPRGRRSRLRNRVIGIRDALIGPLRAHLSADVHDEALDRAVRSGASADEAKVAAEAACVTAALTAFRDGVTFPRQPALTFADDLDAEAAWLARISQATR